MACSVVVRTTGSLEDIFFFFFLPKQLKQFKFSRVNCRFKSDVTFSNEVLAVVDVFLASGRKACGTSQLSSAQYTVFQNGGCLRWSGSSNMKTRHRGPNSGVYKCQYMPQNCCVPECKKKVYVENGVKISFHTFPEERKLFLKWIVAIRDIGKHFQVTTHTRVCSRHFKPSDYLPSLAGRKRTLKPTAGPSVSHWKESSLVKRKAPMRRSPSRGKKPQKRQLRKLI